MNLRHRHALPLKRPAVLLGEGTLEIEPTLYATFVMQLKCYNGSTILCRGLSSPNAQAFCYNYLY